MSNKFRVCKLDVWLTMYVTSILLFRFIRLIQASVITTMHISDY